MTLDTTWSYKAFADWTDEDLLACAKWWAQELGLASWKLNVSFILHRDADESWARVRTRERYEEADIEVVRWLDREGCGHPGAGDLEGSVAHEVVHVRFWSANSCFFDAGSVAAAAYEAAVERTAQALVSNRRRGWK